MQQAVFLVGSAAILAATTIGAGMFALPYIFFVSGWAVGVFYFVILGALVLFVHALYLRVLEAVRGQALLLGLVGTYGGRGWYVLGLVAIVGGLLITLSAYLILGERFLSFIAPELEGSVRVLLFWILCSLPILFRARRLASLELLGILAMIALVATLFFGGAEEGTVLPPYDSTHLFLPFGVILFALAGWNALLPMYEYGRPTPAARKSLFPALVLGTAAVIGFYLLFIWGIADSTSVITPDTISGLTDWTPLGILILGFLGLLAIFTSYVPIGFEITHALTVDMNVRAPLALLTVFFAPLVLFFAGFSDFLSVVRFAGGVFLALQYFLILFVATKALRLRPLEKLFARAAMAVFGLVALYEVYYFIVG